MFGLDNLELLYATIAILFQIVLVVHFALRKWRFQTAIRYGPLFYALSIPAAIVSLILLLGGMNWGFWLGGFIFLVWAVFGHFVEYVQRIEWRNSLRWSILIPYVILYLATAMFYWWPLANIGRPLWYVAATLFVISTILNATSHKGPVTERTYKSRRRNERQR
jgi:hypothetical protein